MREENSAAGDTVEAWRFDPPAAIGTSVPVGPVVGHGEQNVRLFGAARIPESAMACPNEPCGKKVDV